MTKYEKNGPVRLARRDVLMRGGAGVLGTMIAASTVNMAGAQTPSADKVMANLKSLNMGDFNPNYANQWPFRLAQSLGFLEDGGIENLEITLTDEYVPGLVGGSLDMAHGDTSEFLAAGHASGLPITIISMHRDKEWWIMGVGEGIETPEDLKGSTITGGSLAGRNTWIMRQVLTKMGLDPNSDVSFVPSSGGSDSRLGAVINGSVDGASLFPRHRAPLEESGGKFIFEELVDAPQEGFAVMGDWLEQNADTAQAWLVADLKARQWLMNPENKERAYQIMIDLGYEIPDSFRALYDVELAQLSRDGGFEDAAAMQEFVEALAITGSLPEGLDWKPYFDFTYLWAAQEAVGMPKRPAAL
ncbi:MAG: ABC transporter substrate-binding protein [Silicimonas sp.]|nr:ABC transporter substrate-binding protein [Silicimonas sp.]